MAGVDKVPATAHIAVHNAHVGWALAAGSGSCFRVWVSAASIERCSSAKLVGFTVHKSHSLTCN